MNWNRLRLNYHQRAMEIYINALGPNHIDFATSYDNLSSVHRAIGDHEVEQAKNYHQRAIEIRRNA